MKRVMMISLAFVIGFIMLNDPLLTVADDSHSTLNEKSEIAISLSPSDVLFNVENMKPGDWAPRTLTVINDGKNDFHYQISVTNEGEAKLFNELLIELEGVEGMLYEGKLAELETLPKRFLAANTDEELDITVRFPEHLGNEFQGLAVHFNMSFVAEADNRNPGTGDSDGEDNSSTDKDVKHVGGKINDGDNTAGSPLPKTATNMFHYLLIGTCLLLAGIIILIISRRLKRARMSRV